MGVEGEGEKEGQAGSQVSRAGPLFPFSENNMPSSNKTEFQLELPVKYAVYVMVTRYRLQGLMALPSALGWTWCTEHLCEGI